MSDAAAQAHLEGVLKNPASAGVYHLPQIPKETLLAAAAANGQAVFRVDLRGIGEKTGLLDAVARAMHFPDWFGQNLDALADCLGDLGWQPAEGYLVLLEHCDGVHSLAESDFAAMLRVFEEAAAEWRDQGIPFWCLVEMQADGLAWLPSGP